MKYRILLLLIAVLESIGLFCQEITILNEAEVLGLTVNSSGEEIFPLLNKDGSLLYFVRTFHSNNKGGMRGGQDIWYARKDTLGGWSQAVNLSKLNTDLNNAVVGLSENDSTLYLLNTYSDPARWRYGVAYSEKIKGDWRKPKELPVAFNLKGALRAYYVSPNEDVLLLSSEADSTYGKEDIFLYYKENDKWLGPVHLDRNINTSQSEISPFITPDHQVIFFASKGHKGYGDFDIFMSERLDDSWENWSPAVNVGDHINTSGFDGYFSYNQGRESFYVSDKGDQSTDVFAISVELKQTHRNISEMLAYGVFLQDKFKQALLTDTVASRRVLDVVNATKDIPHNINHLLTGNSLMNTRLFGIDERDSLINQYTIEQMGLDFGSNEYAKRVTWNRALSEDINALVDRNAKTEEKLNAIPLNSGDQKSEEFHTIIKELKSDISEQVLINAALKQNISELIAQNSIQKFGFTRINDPELRKASQEKIDSTLVEIDQKIEEWMTNLSNLKLKTNELIEQTALYKVYLNERTTNTLQDDALSRELKETILMDTLVSNQITKLELENPDLFVNIDPLVSGNTALNEGLLEVSKEDSLLTSNVLKMSGVERSSDEFKKKDHLNDSLTQDILNNFSKNKDILAAVPAVQNKGFETMAAHFSAQIAKDITLKQGISNLIKENALLKKSLTQSKDGGDSTVTKISANRLLLEEKIQEWRENIVALENSALEVEKTVDPETYVKHVLERLDNVSQLFEKSIHRDASLNQGIIQLTTGVATIDPVISNLALKNATVNGHLASINQRDMLQNSYITELMKGDADSTGYEKLITGNIQMGQQIDSTVTVNTLESMGILELAKKFVPEESDAYGRLEQELSDLVGANALIKQKITELIRKNALLKQQLVAGDEMDVELIHELKYNADSIENKINEWVHNMEQMQRSASDFHDAIMLGIRINQKLVQHDSLNDAIEQTVAMDREINERIRKDSTLEDSSKSYELSQENETLSVELLKVNSNDLMFNHNLKKRIVSASADQDQRQLSKENISLVQEIQELAYKKNTALDELVLSSGESSSSPTRLLAENTVLKQDVMKLIGRNAALKLYLDSTSMSRDEHVILEIEDNSKIIMEKLSEWKSNLRLMEGDSVSAPMVKNNVELMETDTFVEGMVMDGYAIQILAMGSGVQPLQAYLDEFKNDKINIAKGKDRLDRYYIRKYDTKEEALKEMKQLRKSGFEDVFVRAIFKYTIL